VYFNPIEVKMLDKIAADLYLKEIQTGIEAPTNEHAKIIAKDCYKKAAVLMMVRAEVHTKTKAIPGLKPETWEEYLK
jgi:hypothetical protein